MMLKPLRDKVRTRQQISRVKTTFAPTKGWYVGENLATPPPKTAYFLENVFCQLDYIRVRGGSQTWASGMPSSPVYSLMTFNDASTSKMFAACGNEIYDVSSAGAVPAADVTGLSGSEFQYVQFAGLTGSYLVAVNGLDQVQIFDGTGWNRSWSFTGNTTNGSAVVTGVSDTTHLIAGQAITGSGIADGSRINSIDRPTQITLSAASTATGSTVALTALQNPPIVSAGGVIFSNVYSYKNTLIFIEKNSLNAWYLPVLQIGGTAAKFPMQGIFKKGGYLIAMGDWAIDSTSGIYNGFCFITSEGEVAMYDGTDPSAWSLKGVYSISRPLGPRCTMKAGGDLMVATEDGIVPMSKVEALDQVALQNIAVSQPIAPAWRQAVVARSNMTGWQIMAWSRESMGVISLPKEDAGDKTQFIVNTRTGAWSKYSGWDAYCFAVFENGLFYGTSDGRVLNAEVGASDDGNNYTFTIFSSFDYLDGSMNRKQITMVRPFIQANFEFSPSISTRVDYDISLPNNPSAINIVPSGSAWDDATWDVDTWPPDLINQAYWQMSPALGSIAATIIQGTLSTASVDPDIRLTQTDVMYEQGNVHG